jgi:hypothetical protein
VGWQVVRVPVGMQQCSHGLGLGHTTNGGSPVACCLLRLALLLLLLLLLAGTLGLDRAAALRHIPCKPR